MRIWIFIFLSVVAQADPLNQGLHVGTSVSHFYDAVSVYSNPAALGFQTALNGWGPHGEVTYGLNPSGIKDDYSTGFSLGYFGFGTQSLHDVSGSHHQQYHFSGGFPLSDLFFMGARWVGMRSDNFERYHSVDVGLQYKPMRFWSWGFVANRLNRPRVNGELSQISYTLGTTVRPFERVNLSADIETLAEPLARKLNYQVTAGIEPLTGFEIWTGYHSDYHFQIGLRLGLGSVRLHSEFQPDSSLKRSLTGIQISATRVYPSPIPYPRALALEINSELTEIPYSGNFISTASPSLIEILKQLETAENDPYLELVLLKIENFPLGFAAAQDLFQALSRLRERGVMVEVFLGSSRLKEYFIASAANQIFLEPEGELRFLGLKAERYFLTGTLAKIGAEGQFLAKGKYKFAPEMFTRKESSSLNRETTLEELGKAEAELVRGLSKYRKPAAEGFSRLQKLALLGTEEALQEKLVDGVGTFEAEKERLSKILIFRSSPQRMNLLKLKPRVGVIVAQGDILQKKIGALSLADHSVVTPSVIRAQFKKAISDPRTKAIVLRVNSPGGEILASNEIASIIEEAKIKKPVIVSMGDLAASGGYLISAPADRIFAQTLTLTGSIGVFVGKFSLKDLFKKVELNKEIISRAPYPGLFSEDRLWDEGEIKIMQRRLDSYYLSFVQFVASRRKMTEADAEKSAQGRVWLGESAVKLGIIDANGGYKEAIAEAASRSGLTDYEVWPIEEPRGFIPTFTDSPLAETEIMRAIPHLFSRQMTEDLKWLLRTSVSPFLYLSEVRAVE